MSLILNYSVYGYECFSDDLPSVSDIQYVSIGEAIVDEMMIRTKTDQGNTNIKETWNNDTVLLSKFQNSLEAGNINNSGVKISSFKIKRKLVTELDSIDVGEVVFNGNSSYDFYDYTQQNGSLTYTIIPMGENGLPGIPFDTNVTSQFYGIYLVDKETNNVLVFDKAVGSNLGNVDTTVIQHRTLIDTFAKYPQVFYLGDTNYESFTLTTVLLPDDGDQSYAKYLDVLNKFILNHNPKILKFDNGKILCVEISNPKTSTPMVTWNGSDYIQISVDVVEIEDYISYMKGD